MIGSLFAAFCPGIEVNVNPDRVTATYKDRVKTLKPVVYLSTDASNPVVLGVGEDLRLTEPHCRVDLFCSEYAQTRFKADCLEAFFRYIFRAVVGRKLILHFIFSPCVSVKGADSLETCLCGYQDVVLRNAIMGAGARTCEFVS